MRHLADSIRIASPAEPIWEWLLHLADHYTEWHPDHVSAVWERGAPNRVGSILKAVEYLGGTKETIRFELTATEPPRRFGYRIRGPISVLLPSGGFTLAERDGETLFTATIQYRFGPLTERVFRRRVAALRQHMREEGQNLKRIIESGGEWSSPGDGRSLPHTHSG